MTKPFIPRMRRREPLPRYFRRVIKAVKSMPPVREILEDIAAWVGNDLNRWKHVVVVLHRQTPAKGGGQ